MKKILLLLILFIFSANLSAQLDREHWFAPMVDRTGNGNTFQRVYFSTNETTPFNIDIYSNDATDKSVLIGTVTISKNNPQYFQIPVRNMIIVSPTFSNPTLDLFKPVNKGIYVNGEKPFYASLRFSVVNHAEILTSKGGAGIGTEFRAVMAPMTANNAILNFMTSVMATEDNTNVTISDFNSGVNFSDGVSRSNFTFTLKKGQSYIIDGTGDFTNNRNGAFIGAKIVSDKPVSITNGNFNGQYATTATNSSDILMDQGVPVDKLGQEFILMKGNGNPNNGMEKAIIVAVKNGTQIYLNGATTPIATINAGEHFITPNDAYKLQTFDHYNMHIKTTENAYVYQLLAGDPNSSELATGGFNYIPPLSCYLPKKIDEIGRIQENYVVSNGNPGGILNIPTKLNIITEKGATVEIKRNGATLPLTSSNGPFDVTGSGNWVTYSYPNITDNVAVFSSSAVTAGISAGDDAVGYGGYFAGFSFIPAIVKTEGDCLSDPIEVKLEITEGFDMYQWEIKNNAGVFVNAPIKPGLNANNLPYRNDEFVYYPSQAGIYRARLKQGSCAEVTTQEFKFYNCTTYTNLDYETCSKIDEITPAFSLSTQSVNFGSVVITEPAKKGLAEVLPNGKIKYMANPDASGIDTFKYSYCGTDVIPDCETAQATIQINQIVGKDAVLAICASTATTIFDLRDADVTAHTTASKVYYRSLAGAQNQTASDRINNFTAYPSSTADVFVRIINDKSCVAIQKIELILNSNIAVQDNLYTRIHCDEEDNLIDGNYIVNPNSITPIVLASATSLTVKYYDSLAKAEAGGTDNITGNYAFTPATAKIWIRAESTESCVTVKEITLKIGSKIPLITNNLNADVCDIGFDNTETVDLADYLPRLTSQTGLVPLYYATMPDAIAGKNAVLASQTVIRGTVSTFYYVIKNASFCSDIATVNLTLIDGGFASTTIKASETVCEGSTIEINAGTAHTKFKWVDENDPARVIPSTQKVTLGAGKYHVILTSPTGCEYKQNFEIIDSPKAILDISKFNATLCDNDLDGKVDVKFSTDVTPSILLNPHPDLTVRYYRDATMSTQALGDNFSYQTDTRIYVKVISKYCSDVNGFIDFKVGNRISLINTLQIVEECDDDLDGKFLVQDLLQKYKALFTNDASATVKFYIRKTDAQNEASNNINEINVTNQQLIHVRISNATDCPELAELTIKLKLPKKSDLLVDKTICPDATTDLDADSDGSLGSGFTYEWYSADNPSMMIGNDHYISDLGIGKYFVIITAPNSCPYKQNVEIKAAELPTIEGIEISGSTVKIIAKGGKSPYKYAISTNGFLSNYQDSNTFTNVSPGLHTAYVISADNCEPVEKEFSVVEIYNLISPNGDGVNDVLDMSLLKYKIDVKFQVFDREGRKLFEGDANNNFIWDGKQGGKTLPTSSYWYILEWKDFENSPPVKYTGWILLKNRNSN
ncbi:hypothetical protein D3C87_809290 [compost metagenome]